MAGMYGSKIMGKVSLLLKSIDCPLAPSQKIAQSLLEIIFGLVRS